MPAVVVVVLVEQEQLEALLLVREESLIMAQ